MKRGNYCALLRCSGCKALWCEVPYEPYLSYPYCARWPFDEATWDAVHALDDGETIGHWNAAVVRERWSALPADQINAVEHHRKRSCGHNPIDMPSRFAARDLEAIVARLRSSGAKP